MSRNPSVGYFSSYDRGLMCLLEMWPHVLAEVPEAKLEIYYGWESFDNIHQGNNEMAKFKWQVKNKLFELKDSVSENGRVNHEELAKIMKRLKVWAYPTEFNEINCLTALKAQEAGMIPVTTGCYALKETVVNNKYTVECEDIYGNPMKQKEFIENLVAALKDNDYKVEKVPNVYWPQIAKQWQKVCG